MIKHKRIYSISSPIVFYNHLEDVIVYSQYRPCQKTSKIEYCACSLYIRVNDQDPHYAFIDFCSSSIFDPPILHFRQYKDVNQTPYSTLDCSYVIRDPDNQMEWNNVNVTFDYFKCAKLDAPCDTYIIRTVNTQNNIRVTADVFCPGDIKNDFLSQIVINPAFKSLNYGTGVCSDWSSYDSSIDMDVVGKAADLDTNSYEYMYEINSLEMYENTCIISPDGNVANFYQNPPGPNRVN